MDITFTDRAPLPGRFYLPRIHVHRDEDLSPQRLAAYVLEKRHNLNDC